MTMTEEQYQTLQLIATFSELDDPLSEDKVPECTGPFPADERTNIVRYLNESAQQLYKEIIAHPSSPAHWAEYKLHFLTRKRQLQNYTRYAYGLMSREEYLAHNAWHEEKKSPEGILLNTIKKQQRQLSGRNSEQQQKSRLIDDILNEKGELREDDLPGNSNHPMAAEKYCLIRLYNMDAELLRDMPKEKRNLQNAWWAECQFNLLVRKRQIQNYLKCYYDQMKKDEYYSIDPWEDVKNSKEGAPLFAAMKQHKQRQPEDQQTLYELKAWVERGPHTSALEFFEHFPKGPRSFENLAMNALGTIGLAYSDNADVTPKDVERSAILYASLLFLEKQLVQELEKQDNQ